MRKYAVAIGLVGGMALSTAAHSAAYFIAGQWYFFSLNLVADLGKVTGKDIKDQTFVASNIIITKSETECANPQSHAVNPGTGPKGSFHVDSPTLTDGNLTKKNDRQHGNIYQTTATLENLGGNQRLDPPDDLCKQTNGSQWLPVFWQDGANGGSCDKQTGPQDGLTPPVCYTDLAAFDGAVLKYITGDFKGQPVTNNSSLDWWTFVFLPTEFKYTAYLDSATSPPYGNIYAKCTFPLNNEPGAKKPAQPYSLSNPPANGWAGLIPTSTGLKNLFYQCVPISAAEYAAP